MLVMFVVRYVHCTSTIYSKYKNNRSQKKNRINDPKRFNFLKIRLVGSFHNFFEIFWGKDAQIHPIVYSVHKHRDFWLFKGCNND